MSSKKMRTAKQSVRPLNMQSTVSKKPASAKAFELGSSTEPLYKALFMILVVLVLTFLLNWILNSVFTNIVSSKNPDISNDSALLMEKVQEYVNNSMYYPVLQKIVLELSGILAMIFFFARIEKKNISELGFANRQKLGVNIGLGGLIAFVALLVAFNLLFLCKGVEFTGKAVINPIQLLWAAEFVLMILCEEFIFRGYIRYKLADKKPAVIYIVSCVLFALYKGLPSTSPATYISYAAMNFFFMFVYQKLNSPWFNISFRLVWTFLSGLVLSVYSPGVPGLLQIKWNNVNILTGTQAGFENSLIVAFVFVLAYFGVKMIFDGRLKPGEKYQRRLHKDGTIR